MRSDAVRNRQRILDAAAAAFRAHGRRAQVEDIAHAAGLGVGTVYRHFPDKLALLDAVAATRVEEVAQYAVALRGRDAGEGRIRHLLRWYLARAHDDAVLRIVLGEAGEVGEAGSRLPAMVGVAIAESRLAVEELIALDVADRLLRPDLDYADFRAMCAAVIATMGAAGSDTAWERVLEFILVGIRPADADPA